jgi:hypothetical protein
MWLGDSTTQLVMARSRTLTARSSPAITGILLQDNPAEFSNHGATQYRCGAACYEFGVNLCGLLVRANFDWFFVFHDRLHLIEWTHRTFVSVPVPDSASQAPAMIELMVSDNKPYYRNWASPRIADSEA